MPGELDKIKRHIEKHDALITLFGMEIREFELGRATVSMTVKGEHLNAAGVCHGGTLFALADVAFALASNSDGTLSLALEMSISFTRPVAPGDSITALCTEKHKGRNTGCYVIEVRNSDDKLVSLLKATAFRTGDSLI